MYGRPALESSLCILLIGKTGHGKSATGNTFLERKEFISQKSMMSVTKDVRIADCVIDARKVTVADSPGYADTDAVDLDFKAKNIKLVTDQIRQSLETYSSGYDVIAYVTRFDIRYTEEEMETFLTMKKIIGSNNLKRHGVLVFTHGDAFDEEELKMSFRKWCNQQTGGLRKILYFFGNRVILVNNRLENEADRSNQRRMMIKEFLKVKRSLELRKYTLYNFNAVEEGRNQLMVSAQKEAIVKRVDAKVGEISQKLNFVSGKPSQVIDSLQKIKETIENELWELGREDNNTGLLQSEMAKLNGLRNTADNILRTAKNKDLEDRRVEEMRKSEIRRQELARQREKLEWEKHRKEIEMRRQEREMIERERKMIEKNREQKELQKKRREQEEMIENIQNVVEIVKAGFILGSAIMSLFKPEDSDPDKDKEKEKKKPHKKWP